MKIINIASGKGGTGKTLITAVLAELLSRKNGLKVLVVDMDFFVRGLTALLYFQSEKTARLLEPTQASVADVMSHDMIPKEAGIRRYRTFDVWPSVEKIDQILSYQDVMPDDFRQASSRLNRLLEIVPQSYDLVFLDSRAGYDELIAATHVRSDITINVEEDDLVSRITSDNLIAQLATASKTPTYRIVNKSLEKHQHRVEDLGRIPFDADIMRMYGEDIFWTDITRSLIEPALVDIWNNLCRNENLAFFLKSTRSSPIPSLMMEKQLGRLNLYQRVIAIYGLLLGIAGFVISIGGRGLINEFAYDPFRLIGLFAGIVGATLAYFAMANIVFRK